MEHRQHLHTFFTSLREHELVINAEKYVFGVPSIDFLGYRADVAGITPLPQHVCAVVEFPQPSTVKELQTFLGMLNFYRHLLPSIADILHPLTDSLCRGKKGSDQLDWSTSMRHAFLCVFIRAGLWGPLALPGQFITAEEPPPATFVGRIWSASPQPPARLPTYVEMAAKPPAALMAAKIVYIRRAPGWTIPPLEPLYLVPYQVLDNGPKVFRLAIGGKEESVSLSMDRLKPPTLQKIPYVTI
jgi:hypothetical protein